MRQIRRAERAGKFGGYFASKYKGNTLEFKANPARGARRENGGYFASNTKAMREIRRAERAGKSWGAQTTGTA